MNSNYSAQVCRICLETSDGLVNIFEQFKDTTIASVLVEHFWFQIDKDDGMPEWVCETCWLQTKTFHHFYKRVEFRHKSYTNSIVLINVDEIKRERSVSPIEVKVDFVEEEQTKITAKVEHTQILSKESSFVEDKKDVRCDQDEAEQTTDDKDQPSLDKPTNGHHSRSEEEEQDEEIRRFFEMTCDICTDVEFDSLKTLRKHYLQVHNTRGYVTCCGKQFMKRQLMLDHVWSHVNPNAYPCEQCDKSFSRKQSLKNHVKTHVRAHKCDLCLKAYPSSRDLKVHVQDKHLTDTNAKFHCDICGKSYPTRTSLYSHITNYHRRAKSHVCDGCGRKFKHPSALKYHIERIHPTTPPPKLQCDFCGFWSKNKRSLWLHVKRHLEDQDSQNGEIFNCPICQKEVQSKRMLSTHIRFTHAERKHQCTFCDKAFKHHKNLKEHTAIHTGVDLYNCPYCDRTFKFSANKYTHLKKAHLAEWTRDKAEKNGQVEPSATETTSEMVD